IAQTAAIIPVNKNMTNHRLFFFFFRLAGFSLLAVVRPPPVLVRFLLSVTATPSSLSKLSLSRLVEEIKEQPMARRRTIGAAAAAQNGLLLRIRYSIKRRQWPKSFTRIRNRSPNPASARRCAAG